ncbi:MAG: glycosyltransferase family 2 protein [Treponema sp.]|nr:glycosyltransferase family 2 protein [Clostridia bacterium]MCF0242864.1 glycosyltransferase family 2 protein [Treponema sp.]
MKKSENGISVIIPTFNRQNYLYPTLLCLLNQEIKSNFDFEIIIVDSGTDTTNEMVALLAGKTVRIRYKRIRNNTNRSLLRHCGAKLAKFEYLLFLDNDMLTPNSFLERFYYEFSKNKNCVLLGLRRLLTTFNFNFLGEDFLSYNFEELEKFPWYEDERLKERIETNEWRFTYSHTLGIDRKNYFNVNGFDKEYGKNWGYEDIDLGYKLALSGCQFIFIKDCFDYHQPHFSQSSSEQMASGINRKLMMKKHNSVEMEISICFYWEFEKFYKEIIEISRKKNTLSTNKQDIVIGCIQFMNSEKNQKNCFLGLALPFEDKKLKRIYVEEMYFSFSFRMKRAILGEAFRVTNTLVFKNLNDLAKEEIKKIAFDINLILEIKNFDKYSVVTRKGVSNKTAFNVLLPDITQPERRYVYKWLVCKLKKDGVLINTHELRRIEYYNDEDFSLSEDENQILHNIFDISYGKVPFKTINSLSLLKTESMSGIKNFPDTYVIEDEDVIYKNKKISIRGYEKCNFFDRSCYYLLSYSSIVEVAKKVAFKAIQYDYCCFMENGFKEDGIDLILRSFLEIIKSGKEKTMIIKTYETEKQFKNCYPRHNKTSINNKLLTCIKKHKEDLKILKDFINNNGLEKYVKVLERSGKIEEIGEIISQSKKIIFASRTCCATPQVFMSIYLGKTTIVPKHYKLIPPFNSFCIEIPSNMVHISEEMEFAKVSENYQLLVGKVETEQLFYMMAEDNLRQNSIDDFTKKRLETSISDFYAKIQNRKFNE